MAAKRKSAYFAATEAAQKQQSSEAVTPSYSETAEQLISNTVTRQYSETVEQLEKTTFYLTPEQAEKLDDLATLDSLEGIKRHVRKSVPVVPIQEHPDIEERFRTDTQVHYFKGWLRAHDQPQDSDFAQRFLTDSRLPQHASRGMYEAKMRTAGYSEEDMHLFQDAWKLMLVTES